MVTRRSSLGLRVAFAVAITAIALIFSLILKSLIVTIPFMLFFAAVALSAWQGGLVSAVVSIILSIVVVDYFLLVPFDAFTLSITNVVRLVFFVSIASVITLLIEGQKRTQRQVSQQREWFRATLASIGDAVVATDTERKITFINGVAASLTGWTEQEAIGQPLENVFRIINEITRQPVANPVEKIIREGGVVSLVNHTLLLSKQGLEIPIEDSGSPIKDPDGGVIGTILVFHNVTEQRRGEKALKLSETRFRRLFEQSPFSVQILAPDGSTLQVNDAWVRRTGATLEQIQSANYNTLQDQQLIAKGIMPYIQKGFAGEATAIPPVAYNVEETLPGVSSRKDPEYWVRAFIYPVKDESGNIREVVLIHEDITEQKRAEIAIQNQQQWLEQVLNFMPSPLLFVEPGTAVVTFSNRAADEIAGGEFPKGKPDYSVYYGTDDEGKRISAEYMPTARVARGEQFAGLELNWHTPTGIHPLLVFADTLPAIYGHPATGIIAFQDVAELKQAQEKVRNINRELEQRVIERTAELEASNRELEAFSYSVSHDLRAPLRAINGFATIIAFDHADLLDAETRRLLDTILQNTKQMSALIDDLLTFSRLGRQALNKQPVELTSLVRTIWDDLADERKGRQVEFLVGDLPTCQADPILLKQVFVNLLSNALKFTRTRDSASIEVNCTLMNGRTVLFVKDNGVGFDMAYANKLFGVFQRLHNSNLYEGTGVGLAIVERVIRKHGGEVWAEAELDKGATFYFTLGPESCA